MIFYFIPFLLLCTSCSRDPIQVYTEYVGVQDLASYYVDTPDPYLLYPNRGQRLVIFWSIPRKKWGYNELQLHITVRYGNREQSKEIRKLTPGDGEYILCLYNDEYFEKQGIQSYKIELFGDGILLDERRHQLWVELIEINKD